MLNGLIFTRRLLIRSVGRIFLLRIKHLRVSNTVSRQKNRAGNPPRARSSSNHLLYVDEAPVAHGAHEHPVLRSQRLHGADDDLCKGSA
jgi:hypothetical protein